jgi:hypothetical protein
MIVCPLAAMTIYLVWLWPGPSSTPVLAQTGPYLISLLTGAPFVLALARRRRALALLLYLAGGFVLLWVYALAILCGIRGMCL